MKLNSSHGLILLMAAIQIRAFKDAAKRGDDAAAMTALAIAVSELTRLKDELTGKKAANDNAKPVPPISGSNA